LFLLHTKASIHRIEAETIDSSGKEDKDRYVCADPKTFEMLRAWQGDKGPDALIFDVSDRQVQRSLTNMAR